MSRMAVLLAPCLLLGCPAPAPRAAPSATSVATQGHDGELLQRTVDSTVRAVLAARDIPGTAVAVVRGDRIVLATGYGEANRERNEPVTPDTRFQIASLTKPFTATAVMLLARDEKLKLNDRVAAYLPWLPPVYDSVTVHDLLTHTSGIRRDLRTTNNDDMSADEFRSRLQTAPPSFRRGTSFEYANTGYIVLGMLIERVSGQSFEAFLMQQVLQPAGMLNTRYLVRPDSTPGVAVGYEPVNGVQQRAPYFSGGFAAGGLSSSVRDLARFAIALHRGSLLSPALLQRMWTPGILSDGRQIIAFGDSARSYGYGWEVRNARGRRSVTHGGGLSGFSSILNRFDDGTTIIVLSNSKIGDDRTGHAEAIARAIANGVLGPP